MQFAKLGLWLSSGVLMVATSSCGGDAARQLVTEVIPDLAETCPAGQMPQVGQAGCRPVGATVIPSGFVADGPSGFVATLPAVECEGATRAALGIETCVPLDDCDAAFPPAGTSVVVSKSGGTFGGATVVNNIDDAIEAAEFGGTIALAEGTYPRFDVTKSVNIVGRCVSKVKITGTDARHRNVYIADADVTLSHLSFEGGAVVAAASVQGHAHVVLEAVRVTSPTISILSGYGAQIDVRSSVLEGGGATESGRVSASSSGSVNLVDSQIRHADGIGDAFDHGTIELTRVVVTSPLASGTKSASHVSGGGTITVKESALRVSRAFAHVAAKVPDSPDNQPTDVPGSIRVEASEIIQERASPASFILGDEGASIDVRGSVIRYLATVAIAVGNATSLSVSDSTFLPDASRVDYRGIAIATSGARALFERVAMFGAQEGVFVVSHNGSSLTLRDSLIDGVSFREEFVGDEGDSISTAIVVGGGDAQLTLEGTVIRNVEGTAVALGEGVNARVVRSVIENTHEVPDTLTGASGRAFGSAVEMRSGSLEVSDTVIRRNDGNGLAIYGGTALISDSRILENQTGIRCFVDLRILDQRPDRLDADTVLLYQTVVHGNAVDYSNDMF